MLRLTLLECRSDIKGPYVIDYCDSISDRVRNVRHFQNLSVLPPASIFRARFCFYESFPVLQFRFLIWLVTNYHLLYELCMRKRRKHGIIPSVQNRTATSVTKTSGSSVRRRKRAKQWVICMVIAQSADNRWRFGTCSVVKRRVLFIYAGGRNLNQLEQYRGGGGGESLDVPGSITSWPPFFSAIVLFTTAFRSR